MKSQIGIKQKDELKAHNFVEKGKRDELISFIDNIKGVHIFSAFIENNGIKEKFLSNKNISYNFFVKLAMERAIEI